MGTRCLVEIYDGNNNIICTLYRQYDGYPEGMRADIEKILYHAVITNGISSMERRANYFNGMEELATIVVMKLKQSSPCGNVYLFQAGIRNVGEEYIYLIKLEGDGVVIYCYDGTESPTKINITDEESFSKEVAE